MLGSNLPQPPPAVGWVFAGQHVASMSYADDLVLVGSGCNTIITLISSYLH